MQRGRLFRIVLVILIIGMGVFLIIRQISLKKQLKDGNIPEIVAKDFLPFGSSNNGGGGIIPGIIKDIFNNRNNTNNTNDGITNHLTKIHADVAGSMIVSIDDEIAGPTGVDNNGKNIYDTIPALRYVTKENGYVYDYVPKYKKSYLISDSPIPKISFAHFSPSGNTILFQYLESDLKTEKSILGTLGKQDLTVLPNNIISFSFSKSGKFAYVQKAGIGARFIVKNTNGKESIIYESPLTEWNVSFLGEDQLLITTKPSEYVTGFSYIINIDNKTTNRLWSGITALSTKSSLNGNFILRGETEQQGPQLSLYNVKTGNMTKLNKMGLVEKCSFSEDETILTCATPKHFENRPYPDDWYLGIIKTNDGIMRYTTANNNSRVLTSLFDEIDKEIDVWEIGINNSGNMTSFIDRSTMTLYLYEE